MKALLGRASIGAVAILLALSQIGAQTSWAPGLHPFRPDSLWNTQVPSNAVFSSISWPREAGAFNAGGGMPLDVTTSVSPMVTVHSESRWGFPADPVLPIDDVSVEATGSDRDLIVIVGSTAYNFWQYHRTGPHTATANAWAMCDLITGTGFAQSTPRYGAGTRAIGANLLGGLVTKAEILNGSIDHAIALSIADTLLRPGFVAPAVATDVEKGNGPLQEGEYLAIPLATPIPSNISNAGVLLFRAMQTYGAYIVDLATERSTISLDMGFNDGEVEKLAADAGVVMPLLRKVN